MKEIEAKKKALGFFCRSKSLPGQRRIPELSCKAQRLQCPYGAAGRPERCAERPDQRGRCPDAAAERKKKAKQNRRYMMPSRSPRRKGRIPPRTGKRTVWHDRGLQTSRVHSAGRQMLDFAQNDRTRDTDHREIMSVFGSAEVKNGTER